MLPAFLTTILFSISGVSAMRTTRMLSSFEANFWRLLLATGLLALYAHTLGAGMRGVALSWFALSGFIGFGIGDLALYQAYPRLGSRLVILIVHCVAAPLAAAVEWFWLGQPMTGREALASSLILAGVATALFPGKASEAPSVATAAASRARLVGVGFALVAAAGQGLGAVLSRRAFEVAQRAGEHIDGISAAYQRIWAGLLLSLVTFAWSRRRDWLRGFGRSAEGDQPGQGGEAGGGLRRAVPWLVVNALAGPSLGVSCFQWALAERGTGVVLPIVALTPLVIIPFALVMEGERPSRRSLGGGVIAVVGAVIHAISHARPH